MPVPDYSDWMTPEYLAVTEPKWAALDRSELCALIEKYDPETVVEFCCGTGWIPKGLREVIEYVGIDANPGCIELATAKNPESTRLFMLRDIREFGKPSLPLFDMALGFACLKHFSLADWDEIYTKILNAGNRTITSIFIGEKNLEDRSAGFHHTCVSRDHLVKVVHAAGHKIVDILEMPPLNEGPEPLVVTVRGKVSEFLL